MDARFTHKLSRFAVKMEMSRADVEIDASDEPLLLKDIFESK